MSLFGRKKQFAPLKSFSRVETTVSFTWRQIGEVRRNREGLVFPKVASEPALYRFRMLGRSSSSVYVGETADLARRFHHYANPGPSQVTNQRLNDEIQSTLRSGGQVLLDACTDVRTGPRKRQGRLDLSLQSARRLVENAAILAAVEAGDRLVNR